MLKFLDTLLYATLSFSWLLSFLVCFLWLIRSRSIYRRRAWGERRFYIFLMVAGTLVWCWNGFRPTPNIFEDRVGLYWGIKTENLVWRIVSQANDDSEKTVFRGNSSLAVDFDQHRGWLIFYHFPNALFQQRYEALEFYVRKSDLQQDALLVSLYGDGKVPYPSSDGISITTTHSCLDQSQNEAWACVRVPLTEFKLPGKGIIGIGIGKSNGMDGGTFYLDSVHLIEKR
jgi:hypothetical protein